MLLLFVTAVVSPLVPVYGWQPDGRATLVAPNVVDTSLVSGSSFSIQITVDEVKKLWGYTIVLSYNTTVLTAVSAAPWPPPPYPVYFPPFYQPLPSKIDDAAGYVAISAATYYGDAVGVNATEPIPIAQINFKVDAYGYSPLDLHDTKLTDVSGNVIDHDVVDGNFSNKLLGDVNGDRKVDASDLFDLSKAYGSDPSKPNWNPKCNFNFDNKVDASDLFDLSKNYGKSV